MIFAMTDFTLKLFGNKKKQLFVNGSYLCLHGSERENKRYAKIHLT